MNRIIQTTLAAMILAGLSLPARSADAPAKALYFNDFEQTPEGDVPGDLLILSGSFTIKKVDGNNVMELPGDPLDGFGVIYGPAEAPAASARIFATSTAKRSPEFGIGLGDSGGYRLSVMPAVGQIQIVRGDDVLAQVPFTWKTGTWTHLKIQSRKLADGSIVVEGKAWTGDDKEPAAWAITAKATEAISGKASVWGAPYSSTSVRFDDLAVSAAEE